MPERQTYQLIIHLERTANITVGALGKQPFAAGDYLYTGSAKRNIEKRVARHCRKTKTKRWHIDYLTSHPAARVIAIRYFSGEECQINQRSRGEITIPGFGASDCRAGCGAHLKYLGNENEHRHHHLSGLE